MPDLAELNLVINSSQVAPATGSLNALVDAARKVELQVNVTAQATKNANDGAKNTKSVIDTLIGSYGGLLGVLGTATGGLLSFAAAYKTIQLSGQQDELIQQFTYLTGSISTARAAVESFHQIADEDGQFSFGGIANAGKLLLQVGETAKQIPADLQAIADAAAVSGQGDSGINQITQSLVRLLDTGQLTGRTLVQFQREGVPAIQGIANALHTDYVGALAAVEEKQVSSQQVIRAILDQTEKDYKGAAANIGETVNNLFATLKNIFEDYSNHALDGFDTKQIADFAVQVASAFTGIAVKGHAVSQIAQDVAKDIKALGVTVLVSAASFAILTGAVGALELILTVGPLGIFVATLGIIAGILVEVSDKTFTWGNKTATVGDVIVSTFQVVAQEVVKFLDVIYDRFDVVGAAGGIFVRRLLTPIIQYNNGALEINNPFGKDEVNDNPASSNLPNPFKGIAANEGLPYDILTGATNRYAKRQKSQSFSSVDDSSDVSGTNTEAALNQANAKKALDEMNDKLNEQIQLIGQSAQQKADDAEITKASTQANIEYGKGTLQASAAIRQFEATLGKLDELKTIEQIGQGVGNAFGTAIDAAITKTKSLKDAMKDLFNSIEQTLIKTLVTNPIDNLVSTSVTSLLGGALGLTDPNAKNNQSGSAASLFGAAGGALNKIFSGLFGNGPTNFSPSPVADVSSTFGIGDASIITGSAFGNIFNRGSIVPFAGGGIFGSASYFPMSGGKTGMLGEAGPEAIMPLGRGPDGKLGIAGGGGGTSHQYSITQNISTPDANSFRQSQKVIAQQAMDAIKRATR